MFQFILPDLGEGIHEGELLKWYVSEGDSITEDAPLCDIETDKAAVTIPSPRTGTIHQLNAQPGDIVVVGTVLVEIEDGETQSVTPPSSSEAAPITDTAPVTPSMEKHELASDRMTGPGEKAIAAPVVRRLAREMGIDIQTVKGSGPGGRVLREDLTTHGGEQEGEPVSPPVENQRIADTTQPMPSIGSPIPFLEISPLPEFKGRGERVPMRSLRKKTAVKTTSSSILIPHVAHMEDVDVTEMESVRKNHNKGVAANGGDQVKLTLMAFVIKAVAVGLRQFPAFNASVDTETMEILEKADCHIGFAADTPRGLVVPVIHNTHLKSVLDIGNRVMELAVRGRKGELAVAELTGGTFSVTNVGAIGGTRVFPIINHPESAILGMGRVMEKPVVVQGEIRVRKILPLTLCFDHRVADGAQAALFVKGIKEMLETPGDFLVRA